MQKLISKNIANYSQPKTYSVRCYTFKKLISLIHVKNVSNENLYFRGQLPLIFMMIVGRIANGV